MRKYIIGLIVGLLLSVGLTAHANDIKVLVGKTVQGTFTVVLNGEKLSNEAIVIDGTSYLPVREVAEKLGLNVEFDVDKGITLSSEQTKEVVLEEDNTPEFAGLIVTSNSNNLNINYALFDNPIAEIDSDIRTIEYGDVILYNVNDFIDKFGSELPNGKSYFLETENGYTINKTDGISVSYVKGNKKQAQIINGELYFNIKSYPKLPGYPSPKPSIPTPISGSLESKPATENSEKLQLSPNLQQTNQNVDQVKSQLDKINSEIENKEREKWILESGIRNASEDIKAILEPDYQRVLSDLEELKRQKAELEHQLAP